MSMKELKEALESLAESLSSRDNEVLVLADKVGDLEILNQVARALTDASDNIRSVAQNVESKLSQDKEAGITFDRLDEMVALANSFDESGDELLIRQASVIDDILLTIGANKSTVTQAKRAQDFEIEKLRAKQPEPTDPYSIAKKEHDRDNGVEESRKLISDAVKEYRPLESGLSTRTCPDHPGAQMSRIADRTFQCSLDKGIYNYESGFVTMKGNSIPGGDVSNQTQSLHDRPNEFTAFDTRESRLNMQS